MLAADFDYRRKLCLLAILTCISMDNLDNNLYLTENLCLYDFYDIEEYLYAFY